MPSSFLQTTRASEVRSYRCRGRYLPATSWKLVRFGFPGSYIANLVGSRDRRNDRFDRSWIFARCSTVIPSPARPVPFPAALFLFSLYRRTYSVPLVFIGTNGILWRPVTHCRAASSPLLLVLQSSSCVCDSYPDRILYISGRTGQSSRIPQGLFRPRNYSPGSLASADSRGYKFSFGNAYFVRVESVRLTSPRILDGKIAK